jgi:hypothetical protein
MPDVGDVAAIPLRGGYGACQVVGDGPTACALDWFSSELPDLSLLAQARPLVLDHHVLQGQPTQVNIIGDDPPPPWWVWLGRRELPDGLADRVADRARWPWLAAQIAAQRRWDRELPDAAKRAYRAARGLGTSVLDLTGDKAPAPGPELDLRPRCMSLVWSGPDRGLSEALAAHPMVGDLTWVDAPAGVDLSGTGLTRLRLSAAEIGLLRLPDGLETLKLDEDTAVTAVTAADDGRWLSLTAEGATVPAGLDGLRDLALTGDGTISATPLAGLCDLRRLRLTWRSPPGRLSDAADLAALSRLADLTLLGGYGVDARTLPDLPSLRWLVHHGLYRRAAAAIEARYRDTDVRVDISEVEPEWREF